MESAHPTRQLDRRSLVPNEMPPVVPPAPAAASLDDLTQKLLTKSQKKLAKSLSKRSVLEGKIENEEAIEVALQADLLVAQTDLATAQLELQQSQQQLDDALSMPMGTADEIAAKKAAIAAAKKGLASAKKQLKKATIAEAKLAKKLNKTQSQLAKFALAQVTLDLLISQLESDIAKIEGDFGFQSLVQVATHIVVLDESGLPLAHVTVQLVDAIVLPKKKNGELADFALEDLVTPAVYGQGFTNAQGVVDLDIELPGDVQQVDVLLAASGRSGPYTEVALRQEWGPFAPASRLSVPVDDLDAVSIVLSPLDP